MIFVKSAVGFSITRSYSSALLLFIQTKSAAYYQATDRRSILDFKT